MNPGIPQPDPLPLAAPPAVFLLLLLLTFTLHLLPMNAVLGGSIIGAVARWRGRQGRAHHAELARLIGKLLPVTMAAAVTLGVAALLDDRAEHVLAEMPALHDLEAEDAQALVVDLRRGSAQDPAGVRRVRARGARYRLGQHSRQHRPVAIRNRHAHDRAGAAPG